MDLFAAPTTDVLNDVHECRQFERLVHEPIHTCVVRGRIMRECCIRVRYDRTIPLSLASSAIFC